MPKNLHPAFAEPMTRFYAASAELQDFLNANSALPTGNISSKGITLHVESVITALRAVGHKVTLNSKDSSLREILTHYQQNSMEALANHPDIKPLHLPSETFRNQRKSILKSEIVALYNALTGADIDKYDKVFSKNITTLAEDMGMEARKGASGPDGSKERGRGVHRHPKTRTPDREPRIEYRSAGRRVHAIRYLLAA